MKHIFSIFSIALYTMLYQAQASDFQFPSTVKKITIPTEFLNSDAVILEDEIRFSTVNSGVTRHLRMKILTKKGLEKYKKICLPQGLDFATDYLYSPRYIAKSQHLPLGTPRSVLYFKARIIKPDGTITEAKVRDSVIRYEWQELTTPKIFYNFYYIVNWLNVGDEVDIYYAHREQFYDNSVFSTRFSGWFPYRIFFHSELPKVNFQLKLAYTIENTFKFEFLNNSLPQDTLYEKNENLTDAILIWNFENLPAVGNLWNSKLYEELPHVKYYKAGNLIGTDARGENEKILEYDWNYALIPFVGIKRKYDGYDHKWQSVKALNALYADVVNKTSDTSYLNKVMTFHNYINNEFEYLNDVDLISGEDAMNLRLGKYVSEKKFRYVLKSRIYSEILDRLDLQYYKAIMADKRIDKINPNKYALGYMQVSQFVVQQKNEFFFLRPKTHQFGHHLNELPFYFEDAIVFLVPQRESEARILNLGIAYRPKLISIKTPSSNEIENTRKTYSNVVLDFEKNSLDFVTRLSLSGQFSTLTRGYYTNEYIDSTVSNIYYQKIHNTSNYSKLVSVNKTSEDENFPFTTTFEIKYSDNTLLKHLKDSTYLLNIAHLINHILEKDIEMNVCNSYYIDFKNTDIYRYYIKTSSPIRVVEKVENLELNSAIGKFVFQISQKSENELLIDSYFQMSAEKVNANDLASLKPIIQKLKELQSANIKIIKKQ